MARQLDDSSRGGGHFRLVHALTDHSHPPSEAGMRTTVATVIAVAASLTLAACAERDTTSPRAAAPDRADASGNPNQGSCNFNNVKSAAGNYFVSNKDTVYGLIKSMSGAYTGGGAT